MASSDESFNIPGAEGEPIAGDVYLPPGLGDPPLLLLIHGFKGFKDWGFFPWLARAMADAGLAVCAFNLSHCGIQRGQDRFDRLDLFEADTWGKRLHDLSQVLLALQEGRLAKNAAPNPARIGLLGHSAGGALALMQAARDGRVRSVGTLAAPASSRRLDSPLARGQLREFGHLKVMNTRTRQEMRVGRAFFDELDSDTLDVPGAAAQLTLPWLIVHGTDDESVPFEDAQSLLDAAARNPVHGENVKLLSLEGTGHALGATHPFTEPGVHLEQAASALTNHFLRTL